MWKTMYVNMDAHDKIQGHPAQFVRGLPQSI
jgi:hypothetical protein